MDSYIKNVKISLFLKRNLFAVEKSREKIFHRLQNLHLTIYKHSPSLINITGIKSLNLISESILLVENFFNVEHSRYDINCIMISFKASQKIRLRMIQNVLNMFSNHYRCEFHPELFSGAILKSDIYPTILLFHTASFQIFGKRIEHLEYAFELAQRLSNYLEVV